ncbi:hypothetical protein EDI_009740 [Entamoeba dispar SAW760]|uniref:Uncharacterized protein n=1 Tax=Entamoeba dispar (strain ATCC PRA-260 / SAW760) TaxID=370354 RepID=B0EG84_ENTDS|nr:uncharacterized protein EDI_009740 [Entamoeba dispar SAW760]EDR26461.1 hypothetical protein EDI_009740 [Entamoeba dispar SAW760]|eukprot:EDR26461.1 hypothetical protein EDI_009740 [Entamoeba dispar SAW760]
MGDTSQTQVAIWLLIGLHIISFIGVSVFHVINTMKSDKINYRIHLFFVSMYLFIITVILTLLFDFFDLKSDGPINSSIYNVMSFLTSSLNHFFQLTYFFVALEVINNYIDKSLYNKPTLFIVCRRVNQVCYVILFIIINPSFGFFFYDYSIKTQPAIDVLFDCGFVWQYYCVLTIFYCIIMFISCINAIILSYMTKDGISYSGILLSPLKTMVCVDIVSVLFLIQSSLRFISNFYMIVSAQTSIPRSFTDEFNTWLQFFVICIVHFPTMFILIILLTPFTKTAKFNMKGY